MAITFKTRIGADVVMLDANARQVLDVIGKPMARGVITAAEAPQCIARLKAAIAAQGEEPIPDARAEPERASTFVALKARFWPFIEMLEKSRDKGCDILWGV